MTPTYFISAGEHSGDLIGAGFIKAMGVQSPDLKAFGVGGTHMIASGLDAVATTEDLSVMGFVEVLSHIPRLKRLESRLLEEITRRKPLCAVLIDYPGFHMRLAERLGLMGIPVIQYVAPQLWAWGRGRTKKLARVTDLVLGVMPFEEQFFEGSGVNLSYVGTPQVERMAGVIAHRKDFDLPQACKLLGVFPGSRTGEITRILPRVLPAAYELVVEHEQAYLVVSLADTVSIDGFADAFPDDLPLGQGFFADIQRDGVHHVPGAPVTIVRGRSQALMNLCDAALVTSGTATLECALAGTPMAVVYVAGALTYAIGKHLVDLENISLVNLVAGKKVVKEFVQEFSKADLKSELSALLLDQERISRFQTDMVAARARLKGDMSINAARSVLEFLTGIHAWPPRRAVETTTSKHLSRRISLEGKV